jgi:hypothetical protein
MSNIDDFLANIEAKYQAKKRVSQPQKPAEKANNLESMERKQSESLDDLLKEFEIKTQPKVNQTSKNTDRNKQNNSQLDDILTEINTGFKAKKAEVKQEDKKLEYLDNLVEQYQKRTQEESVNKKQENLLEIQQQEINKQRQEKQLLRQAEQWLKNLDTYSDEGFWFEQFASSYPSKLEAAIEYLKALNQNS